MGTWPVRCGHPCFGCSEKGIGFNVPLFVEADITKESVITPAATPAGIKYERGGKVSGTAAGLVGAAIGAAAGAAAVTVTRMKSDEEK